ncbi:hypothetical protein HMPREF0183_0222 [Brevibacterium mcbrellneri ATCC 49030]|uniref:Uncharacterized protein n=1 Tax=Brevibacterium mcbrellneri ATCC 49030 TaxID=585530 RepID=D4YJW2_9MICO|nr:hypothetical protein HMPREF0183_0222 [Brevibacterium mcbrellneri ATCC 49030]
MCSRCTEPATAGLTQPIPFFGSTNPHLHSVLATSRFSTLHHRVQMQSALGA